MKIAERSEAYLMVEEAIKKIKEKEAACAKALERAKEEAEEAIREAQKKAEELLKETEARARKEAENLIEKEEELANKEAQEIKKKSLKEKTRIRKATQKRMNKAASFIAHEIVK